MKSKSVPDTAVEVAAFRFSLQIVCRGLIQYLPPQAGMKLRRGIYGPAVVLWLMMLQRLHPRGTVVSAVQLLIEGAAEPLLVDCQRVRRRQISGRTGAIAKHSRKAGSMCLCRMALLELESRPELRKQYPPPRFAWRRGELRLRKAEN